jgi:very-short-patch-repair endonuclease
LVVYASFLPEQLRAERSNARGVHDLKAFLEYAEKGPEAIIARIEGSQGGYDSPLEQAVAEALEARGWRVETQIGVSGFRIDLGVVHPEKCGAYLAGVECDGATYHRSAVARDRDKIRQQVLENLGWRIFRVWSTDWWYDPHAAIEQLDQSLRELLDQSKVERNSAAPAANEPQTDPQLQVDQKSPDDPEAQPPEAQAPVNASQEEVQKSDEPLYSAELPSHEIFARQLPPQST